MNTRYESALLAVKNGTPMAEAARKFGVNRSYLYQLNKKFNKTRFATPPTTTTTPTDHPLFAENARLRRILGETLVNQALRFTN